MFEQTLIATPSPRSRATALLLSTLTQSTLIFLVGVLPLVYYEPLRLALFHPTVPLIAPTLNRPLPPTQPTGSTSTGTQSSAVPTRTPRTWSLLPTQSAPSRAMDFGEPTSLAPSGQIPGNLPFAATSTSIPATPPPPPPPAPQPAPTAPLRVGGNVQSAQLLHMVRPDYPALARQMRVQGTVRFAATIRPDGAVAELQTLSGHPLLVAAATAAVSQWRYRPTLLNGVPVAVLTTIDVHFHLGQP